MSYNRRIEEGYKKMRDPERIDRICDLLKEVWKKRPDERLGQLLLNYIFGKNAPHDAYIFHKEDDITEKSLERLKEFLT